MAAPEEKSPPGDQAAGDDETVNGSAQDTDADVPQLVVEEAQDEPKQIETSNGSVAGRFREIMQDQHEDGSELSSLDAASVDALPRRAGSPIDSVMSIPDDTPSIQV